MIAVNFGTQSRVKGSRTPSNDNAGLLRSAQLRVNVARSRISSKKYRLGSNDLKAAGQGKRLTKAGGDTLACLAIYPHESLQDSQMIRHERPQAI